MEKENNTDFRCHWTRASGRWIRFRLRGKTKSLPFEKLDVYQRSLKFIEEIDAILAKRKGSNRRQMKIMYKEDLDQSAQHGCSVPDCEEEHGLGTPIHFQQTCHPGGPKDISYCDGVINITCEECFREIANIKVGQRGLKSIKTSQIK